MELSTLADQSGRIALFQTFASAGLVSAHLVGGWMVLAIQVTHARYQRPFERRPALVCRNKEVGSHKQCDRCKNHGFHFLFLSLNEFRARISEGSVCQVNLLSSVSFCRCIPFRLTIRARRLQPD